jgi:hypothetical protein
MAVILVLPMGGIMNYAVEMSSGGIIHIQRFIKIGTGVRAILKFCFSNFNAVMLVLLMVIYDIRR